jgi:DNA (cytosine-5)-methyltransferase 1
MGQLTGEWAVHQSAVGYSKCCLTPDNAHNNPKDNAMPEGKISALNLYCGVGGNRDFWPSDWNVTAVEIDEEIASYYQSKFTNDTVIVGDAHDYLLKNYSQFDFIWASPPCQSHGQYRHNVGVIGKGYDPLYPDMRLYEEILFLKHHSKGAWAVENVIPYYEPLIPAYKIGRHLVWSSLQLKDMELPAANIRSKNKLSDFGEAGTEIAETRIKNKRQALRNKTESGLSEYIVGAFCQQYTR